jgi:mannose-6-phosphate isomerase-like protein (cupin superfamily)
MSESAADFAFDRSRLAMNFDVETLQRETRELVGRWPPYVYYSVIPLTMPGEPKPDVTDFSDPDWTTWIDTPALRSCPSYQAVLDSLRCRKTNVRMMRLEPQGRVDVHTDPQLNLDFRNQVRLHVPIFVTDDVEFVLNDRPVPLKPGELWYMRLSDPHRVHNRGQAERIQLSIDVVVNEWVEKLIVDGESS